MPRPIAPPSWVGQYEPSHHVECRDEQPEERTNAYREKCQDAADLVLDYYHAYFERRSTIPTARSQTSFA
jgi:hypothetical protein